MAQDEFVDIRIRLKDARKFMSDAKGSAKSIDKIEKETLQADKAARKGSLGYKMFGKNVNHAGRASKFGAGMLKKAAGAALAAGSAYLGISAARSAVTTTVDLAKATIGLHKNLGLSVESSSAWAAVARSRGVDAKALNMSFGTLSKNATAAAEGTGASVDAFKKLGITQKELKTMSFEDVLARSADGLKKMGAGQERTALTMKLFGRGWQTVVPLLRGGSKEMDRQLNLAKKYGVTFKGHTVKSLGEFIQAERESKMAMMGLQVTFGTMIIPKLTKFLLWMNKTQVSMRKGESIFGDFKSAMKGTAKVIGSIIHFFQKHKTAADVLGKAVVALTGFLIIYKGVSIAVGIATKIAAVASGAWTAAQWLLNVALTANPIGLIIVGIAALAAGLFLAYKKVTWFRNAVNAVFGFVKKYYHWLILPIAPILFPILFIVKKWRWFKNAALNVFRAVKSAIGWVKTATNNTVGFVTRKWDQFIGFFRALPGKLGRAGRGMFNWVKDAFKAPINWVIRKWNSLEFGMDAKKIAGKTVVPGFHIGTPNIPLLAAGGNVIRSGASVVGDAGPEVLDLPRGARVTPLTRRASRVTPLRQRDLGELAGRMGDGRVIELHSHSYIDGREVQHSVTKHAADKAARR